jgi:Putative transposase/Transposase zinc-binding domain
MKLYGFKGVQMKMAMKAPLKQFLKDTIPDWDHDGTPPNVRANLWKIVKCGTAALGAEVFASTTNQKIVYHTCKSRFCPSCGARNAGVWQAKLESAIPETPYQEINFTMPQVFWSLFADNRELLNDLAAVGARAIEYWANARHGARVILMVVQQTYGGFLNFYPHLHTLVSAGGLDETRVRWIPNLEFTKNEHRHELMLAWRFALLAYVNAAIQAKILKSERSVDQLALVLDTEGKRDWNIFVSQRVRKKSVVDHIGRYIRKPPIAQYRLTRLNDKEVQYFAKDTRNKCLTPVRYTNQEFLTLLIPHVADRYCNSMRYFGLLAPRSKILLSVVFDLLNQQQRPIPGYLPWATSLARTFGVNPLIGQDGSVLRRVGSIKASSVSDSSAN